MSILQKQLYPRECIAQREGCCILVRQFVPTEVCALIVIELPSTTRTMARKRRIVEEWAKKGEACLDFPSSDPPESGTLIPPPNQEIAHEFETRAHQE